MSGIAWRRGHIAASGPYLGPRRSLQDRAAAKRVAAGPFWRNPQAPETVRGWHPICGCAGRRERHDCNSPRKGRQHESDSASSRRSSPEPARIPEHRRVGSGRSLDRAGVRTRRRRGRRHELRSRRRVVERVADCRSGPRAGLLCRRDGVDAQDRRARRSDPRARAGREGVHPVQRSATARWLAPRRRRRHRARRRPRSGSPTSRSPTSMRRPSRLWNSAESCWKRQRMFLIQGELPIIEDLEGVHVGLITPVSAASG